MKPIVQISLDVVTIDEALSTAEMALRAGVDWLEAGTPLIIAEGHRFGNFKPSPDTIAAFHRVMTAAGITPVEEKMANPGKNSDYGPKPSP